MWPAIESKLFDAFLKDREAGKPVRDSWFRRNSIEFWKEIYPHLPPYLFVYSWGWFRGVLAHHRIVLRLVTNTVQSLPTDYKEQIIEWLRFNRRNRILTLLFHSRSTLLPTPFNLHVICNDNDGGIPIHRICNVDETTLLWQYLICQT